MIAVCPSCRNELEFPEVLADQPVRCGACGNVFTPGLPAAIPQKFDARSFPDTDTETETRPIIAAPPSNIGIWLLAFVTTILFGALSTICVWGVLLVAYPEFESTEDAVGGFQAVFPAQPTAIRRTWGNDQLVQGQEFSREIPDERYFVYYTDWPADQQQQPIEDRFDTVIEWLLDQFPGMEEVDQDRTTHDGYPARDLLANGVEFQSLIARIIQADDRVYVVGITGPITPVDARVRQFFHGFHIMKR